MDDEKTVLVPQKNCQEESSSFHSALKQQELLVSLLDSYGKVMNEFSFSHNISGGRSLDNDIVIQSISVSRNHFEVKRENEKWWIYNLNSANGIYINYKQVTQKSQLDFPVLIFLGHSGISLKIDVVKQNDIYIESMNHSVEFASESIIQADNTHHKFPKEDLNIRLLTKEEKGDSGDYTGMMSKIIFKDRRIKGKNHKNIIWGLICLFLIASSMVAYQQTILSNTHTLAKDMFYDIKTLEVDLAQSEIRLEKSANVLALTMKQIVDKELAIEQERIKTEQKKISTEKARVIQKRRNLNNVKAKYQQFVKYVQEEKSLKKEFPKSTQYEDKLIAKVARGFGESELEVPDGFAAEVKRYIEYWQQTPRLRQAITRLEQNNYMPTIIEALETEGLPLYFMYLPLQESEFKSHAIGPKTRFGIAKGAWQFLATTGKQFGLTLGPLVGTRKYDEHDERFDFDLATRAGAKYLKYIYSTEAQASGLLVMAGYNYGHTRVKRMIKKMPDNPRDRNFWKFIQRYKIPKQTYDYVFYIFSAAVIGENPAYFGFEFEKTLPQNSI